MLVSQHCKFFFFSQFEASKNSSDISIPEEEFLIYKEKEEHNIEKVEEIVFR